MLNLALGGFPTFTTDVGGYFDFVAPRTTPELLARWGQLAALTPVMRVHDSTQKTSLYPHDLEGAELDAYRRYSKLKVRLAPLVDRLTREAAAGRGVGPVRPLVLADASAQARSLDDQWLVGEDLLVAPVLEQGATSRSVYLPVGARWQPVRVGQDGELVRSGPVLAGGQRVDVPVTLADIPLFTHVGGSAPGAAVNERAQPAGAGLPATGGELPAGAAAVLLTAALGMRALRRSGAGRGG
jgi:alpha-glucosidase (family GH31 glycosyl hydrolase)